jgi:hypothetical protein
MVTMISLLLDHTYRSPPAHLVRNETRYFFSTLNLLR